MKKLIVLGIAVVFVAALSVSASTSKATLINRNGDKVVVAVGSSEANRYFSAGYVLMGQLGGFYSPDITGLQEKIVNKSNSGAVATSTLRMKDSGTTYLISGTSTHFVLPAVSNTGAKFRFIINGATAIEDLRIQSAAGDDIEGNIMVAGANVDCNAADMISFVVDGENIGDYVELISTGTYWIPLSSGASTTAKMTCSG